MLTPFGQRHIEILKEIAAEQTDFSNYAADMDAQKMPLAKNMISDQARWLGDWIANLGLDKNSDPAVIVRKCIGGMEEARKRDFILTNILEAAKHGTSPGQVTKRLEALTILPHNIAPSSPPPDDSAWAVQPSGWLEWLRDGLRTFSRKLAKMGVNALWALADKTKIKIKPSVQLAPFPSLGFTFDLDFETEISGKELFEIFEPLGLSTGGSATS